MTVNPHPDHVRDIVVRTLEELGVSPWLAADAEETILINEGQYVGRSYRVDGYMAMWLVPAGLIQFYNAGGDMLRTINLLMELRPQRAAA